tara:strand:+ start:138 stop:764 length:627 start_codon:yes stop_codon:yes gene_type:complete
MNHKTKQKIGIGILITVLIGYAYLAEKFGGLIYPILLLLVVIILVALIGYKYPKTRPFIFSFLRLIWGFISAVFSESGRNIRLEKRVAIPNKIRDECRNRDKGCKYPKCNNSLDVCDLHHIDQDNTNSKKTSNLIHFCTNHHRRIHNTNKKPVTNNHIKQLQAWTRDNYETQYQKASSYGFELESTSWYKKVKRTIIEEEEIIIKKKQ